jgi:tetratricopeptide (TPR) repeat protein
LAPDDRSWRAVGARALYVTVAVFLAGGCVARSATTSPFLKKAPGFVDVGGPEEVVTPVKREEFERARREAVAKRAAEKRAPLPSIESNDPALGEALAALGTTPSVATHLRVAEQYMRVGVRDMAFDHYSDALQLEPRNVAAFDGRARLWRDVGFLAPALADAHRAKYFAPRSAEVRNTLGTILERRGLCHDALVEYQEALRLKPDAAWAQQNVTRLTDTCL